MLLLGFREWGNRRLTHFVGVVCDVLVESQVFEIGRSLSIAFEEQLGVTKLVTVFRKSLLCLGGEHLNRGYQILFRGLSCYNSNGKIELQVLSSNVT